MRIAKMRKTKSASLLCLMIVNCILSNEYHEFVLFLLLLLFSILSLVLSWLPSRFVSFLHFKNTFLKVGEKRRLDERMVRTKGKKNLGLRRSHRVTPRERERGRERERRELKNFLCPLFLSLKRDKNFAFAIFTDEEQKKLRELESEWENEWMGQ